jgi:hypothetical protein
MFGSYVGREAEPDAAQLTRLAEALKEQLSNPAFMRGRKLVGADELFDSLGADLRVTALVKNARDLARLGADALSKNA